MATHRITSAHAEKSKLKIEFETVDPADENAEPILHTLNVPKWHYRPKAVVLESKKWLEKENADRKKSKDDEVTALELMIFTVGLVQPELKPLVDGLSMGEQHEIWQVWSGEVPISEGESEASSDS